MSAFLIIVAMVPAVLLCALRRNKYSCTRRNMIVILLVFCVMGACGAVFVQFLVNGSLQSKRLYGLIIADCMTWLILSKIIKVDTGILGDYIAAPVIATCCFSKIDCIQYGCCYGIKLFLTQSGEYMRFPSQIFELIIWAILVIVLLILETRERIKGFLWPFAMIWFGILRYAVDFLRGSRQEQKPYFFHMPAGRFWSLIVLLIGLMLMYIVARKKYTRHIRGTEFVGLILGRDIS